MSSDLWEAEGTEEMCMGLPDTTQDLWKSCTLTERQLEVGWDIRHLYSEKWIEPRMLPLSWEEHDGGEALGLLVIGFVGYELCQKL